MARYRFHCTNGYECVLDAKGKDIRAPARLPSQAQQVAHEVMRTHGEQTDWSDWNVTVHDLKGRRVLVQRFAPRPHENRALAA